MYFLLNLSHYVRSYRHFCQIFGLFMIPAHKIWSCHVTQEANFENVLFCPNSTFNIRKLYKVSSGKALYFRSYQPKTSLGGGGVEIPPSAFRVNALERGAVVHQTIPRTLCPLLSHTCIHSCHTWMKIACCFDVTGARSGFLFPQNMNFRWLFFWTELRGVQYTKPMSSKKSLSCR